jgi:hypothetical protein
MFSTGFFKGTSADQDRRFSDKELKLLKSMKFPPEFEKKVIVGDLPYTYLLSLMKLLINFYRLI